MADYVRNTRSSLPGYSFFITKKIVDDSSREKESLDATREHGKFREATLVDASTGECEVYC